MELNKIYEIIDRQFKGKSVIEKGSQCMYKTEDGRKCFIGLFIPDGHEAQSLKGDVHALLHEYPDLLELMPSYDYDTLDNLQRAHDELGSSMTLNQQKQCLKDKVKQYIGA